MQLALLAATICPMAALGVRRLHDQGRSGWWILLALPAVSSSIWESVRRAQDRFAPAPDVPTEFAIAGAAGLLAVFVLMALRPQPGENRYGIDPRDDPAIPY